MRSRGRDFWILVLHDLHGLGSLTTIWLHSSNIWDRATPYRGRRNDERQEDHGNGRTGSRKPVNLGNSWHARCVQDA